MPTYEICVFTSSRMRTYKKRGVGSRTSLQQFHATFASYARLGATMTVIVEVLVANEVYSRTHELRALTPRPVRKLAILTCMDTRLSILTLDLTTGDDHIIGNADSIGNQD